MHHLIGKLKKHWEFGLGRTVLAAICAHSVSISIGICQGYSAILIPQLTSSNDIKITLEQSSWIASFGAITNPIGSILSGLLAEWLGRKFSIQFTSVPFVTGWICIVMADGINVLYAGRLITGIAAGMATASYTYVAEISTPKTRGVFQALGPVSASFGILLTYILGYFFHWKIVCFVGIIFGLFTLITMHFLPESPSYLYEKNKKDGCIDSLLWFRRSCSLVQEEYNKLEGKSVKKPDELGFFGNYLNSKTLKPFGILIGLFFLQELSGIYAILFYSVNFFKDANINLNEYVSSIIVGFIRFIMSIFGAILINKFNRKSLCVCSSFGMSISMLVIVAYLKYLDLTNQNNSITIIPLICVLFNVFFSMIGLLPIPWILVGELFPIRVRSIMSGLVICIAQIFIFLSVKFYPDAIEHMKFSGTCALFLTASTVCVVFSKYVLPETKNKSLEEIENDFEKKGIDNKAFSNDSEGIFTVKV